MNYQVKLNGKPVINNISFEDIKSEFTIADKAVLEIIEMLQVGQIAEFTFVNDTISFVRVS